MVSVLLRGGALMITLRTCFTLVLDWAMKAEIARNPTFEGLLAISRRSFVYLETEIFGESGVTLVTEGDVADVGERVQELHLVGGA